MKMQSAFHNLHGRTLREEPEVSEEPEGVVCCVTLTIRSKAVAVFTGTVDFSMINFEQSIQMRRCISRFDKAQAWCSPALTSLSFMGVFTEQR